MKILLIAIYDEGYHKSATELLSNKKIELTEQEWEIISYWGILYNLQDMSETLFDEYDMIFLDENASVVRIK